MLEFIVYILKLIFNFNLGKRKELEAKKKVKYTDEFQYIFLIKNVFKTGIYRNDRTNIGTLSIFGYNMRFDLRNNKIPVLTTKKVFWRGVVEELLWFISGSTDANILKSKNVNIWNDNASRESLDKRGLTHLKEGDIGAGYGFQWRHFGAKYVNKDHDYTNQGKDQLLDVIDKIKNDPTSRRIIMSGWNPTDLDTMALPPCNVLVQFWVDIEKKELHSQLYQRSCDIGLGVPFNIASYSLLTCMIAHVCDLKPGEFSYCMGDAHIYTNHVEALRKQIKREVYETPLLNIKTKNKDITKFTSDDFELLNYTYHSSIKMEMAL